MRIRSTPVHMLLSTLGLAVGGFACACDVIEVVSDRAHWQRSWDSEGFSWSTRVHTVADGSVLTLAPGVAHADGDWEVEVRRFSGDGEAQWVRRFAKQDVETGSFSATVTPDGSAWLLSYLNESVVRQMQPDGDLRPFEVPPVQWGQLVAGSEGSVVLVGQLDGKTKGFRLTPDADEFEAWVDFEPLDDELDHAFQLAPGAAGAFVLAEVAGYQDEEEKQDDSSIPGENVVAYVDADGDLRWHLTLEVGHSSFVRNLSVGPDGTVMLVGEYTQGDSGRPFVAQFTDSGDLRWSHDFEHETLDLPKSGSVRAVAIDVEGKVYLAGQSFSEDDHEEQAWTRRFSSARELEWTIEHSREGRVWDAAADRTGVFVFEEATHNALHRLVKYRN